MQLLLLSAVFLSCVHAIVHVHTTYFFSFQDTYFNDKTREASFQDQEQEQLDTESSPDSQQSQVQDE